MFQCNKADGYKILITFLIYEIIYFVLIHQSFLWNVIKLHFDSKDEMFLWNKGDGNNLDCIEKNIRMKDSSIRAYGTRETGNNFCVI